MADDPVLSVRGLKVTFVGSGRPVPAVRGIDFDVSANEVLGIVGESGSGKSVTSLAISGLLDETARVEGSIRVNGVEVTTLDAESLRRMRGRDVGMVFQDPTTTLNPVLPIGRQVIEGQVAHGQVAAGQALTRSVELLREVDIPDPEGRVVQFPHQFSGGMRQRAVIAMAMAGKPRLIIADEPTTALDVTVQAQVLSVLAKRQRDTGAAVILITHDLGVVAEVAHRVAVMYGGRIVESGSVREIFARPRHPYTVGLLRSVPRIDIVDARLVPIPGQPPSPAQLPGGCTFHPRCAIGRDRPVCARDDPALREVGAGHHSACHFTDEVAQLLADNRAAALTPVRPEPVEGLRPELVEGRATNASSPAGSGGSDRAQWASTGSARTGETPTAYPPIPDRPLPVETADPPIPVRPEPVEGARPEPVEGPERALNPGGAASHAVRPELVEGRATNASSPAGSGGSDRGQWASTGSARTGEKPTAYPPIPDRPEPVEGRARNASGPAVAGGSDRGEWASTGSARTGETPTAEPPIPVRPEPVEGARPEPVEGPERARHPGGAAPHPVRPEPVEGRARNASSPAVAGGSDRGEWASTGSARTDETPTAEPRISVRPEPVEGRERALNPGGTASVPVRPEPVEGARPEPVEGPERARHHGGAASLPVRPEPVEGARPEPVEGLVEAPPLLTVDKLQVFFPVKAGLLQRRVGWVRAVDGVSLTVRAGETLGLVGESGCGKTTTGRAIMGLVPITSGRVAFDGRDITQLPPAEMRKVRRHMQYIFQDPYSSLNPIKTVGEIVAEPLRIHGLYEQMGGERRIAELFDQVGLPSSMVNRFPQEFSGGQRQRIGIARALALKPRLLILDEPVAALDVSIQAQVINLLQDLQRELGLAYLFIAHDLSVVRHISDRVAVMYLGRIVEESSRDVLYAHATHPYTQSLLSAVPVPDPESREGRSRIILEGDIPNPARPPAGCHFNPRCFKATDVCRRDAPAFVAYPGLPTQVACHHAGPLERADAQAAPQTETEPVA